MEKKTSRFIEGLRYLFFSIEVFGVIGFELLLAYVIEPLVYKKSINEFNTPQSIIHWLITCTVWLTVPFLVGGVVYYVSFFRQLKKANEIIKEFGKEE